MLANPKVPTFDRLMWPALVAMKELGGSATHEELLEKVIELEGIPENVQNVMHTERQTKISYNLAWAKTYLGRAGALGNPSHGLWAITEKGKALTEEAVNGIPAEVRKQYRVEKDKKPRGLLLCFSCRLDPELQATISTQKDVIKLNLVNHIREFVRQPPLAILARSVDLFSVADGVQKELFSSYAEFLQILDDKELRGRLQSLRAENSRNDATFRKIRQISSVFENALDRVFFESPKIAPLTRKYGVF